MFFNIIQNSAIGLSIILSHTPLLGECWICPLCLVLCFSSAKRVFHLSYVTFIQPVALRFLLHLVTLTVLAKSRLFSAHVPCRVPSSSALLTGILISIVAISFSRIHRIASAVDRRQDESYVMSTPGRSFSQTTLCVVLPFCTCKFCES